MARYNYLNNDSYIPIIEHNRYRNDFNCPCCNKIFKIEEGIIEGNNSITKPIFANGKRYESKIGHYLVCAKCLKKRKLGFKLDLIFMALFVVLFILACLSMVAFLFFHDKQPEWLIIGFGGLTLLLGLPISIVLIFELFISHIIFKTSAIDFDKALKNNAIRWICPPQRNNE